ncbi:MAG: bifunctional isocitrate dehydrogenase kinase/phosphatase [Polyangiaceae bacterium]
MEDLAAEMAATILAGFDKHYRLFRETSARGKERWERADWAGARQASRARIDMYDQRVAEAVSAVRERFAESATVDARWPAIKRAYVGMLLEHKQPECAETFFNSVARHVLDRRYYRNDYIFSRPAIATEHLDGDEPTYRCYYPPTNDLRETFRAAIEAFELEVPFADLDRDIELVQKAIDEHFPTGWDRRPNFQVHVLRSLFFRNTGAYVVGRVVNGDRRWPFVVAMLRDAEGRAYVDALLLDARNVGRLLSLGRSYFFVDMEVPAAYVSFLETIVPSRTRAELYTMIGLQKQGKTLFFRDIEHHLKHSTDKFTIAPGTRGMVMLVFTLPSFPFVFKVIRDWFEPPKDADRQLVEERYRFVKLHDRAGRMSDTLEFAHVAFPRDRFSDELIAELERIAPSSFEVEGEHLVTRHFYIERRLVPLDVYLSKADGDRAAEAIDEYGHAIRDLAGANIFPGDLLLKNFGLTRYGRVVFYDYDELCEVTDCRFRRIPTPSSDEEEMRAEPFFNIEPNDVFPEQFPMFLFPEGPQRDAFMARHADLADPAWWTATKQRILDGGQDDVISYSDEVRLHHRWAERSGPGPLSEP